MISDEWSVVEALELNEDSLSDRIFQEWIGQPDGESFGTAIVGFTGKQIPTIYQRVSSTIIDPKAVKDDEN